MSLIEPGGIDCDIHPAVPNLRALHPYLSDHWRDIVIQRGVHELESIAYPANSPLTSRPDWRLPNGKPGSDLDALRAHALTPFGTASPSATASTAYSCCSPRTWAPASPAR